MLHKCQECATVYLVSEFRVLCNTCGEYLKQRVERVYEDESSDDWVGLLSEVAHGVQPQRERRWEVR